ncbi:putative phage-related protein [Elusimicrobium minutum Pei191]|uniref:Putative phage-related protein n=1 Tax=Elusimicrobium minutum (strain Pei191) TaxID=445932 RepID=B2KEQ5_ELUMP|nr:sce7726 family protein [Elusimicrobium minutum]ACC99001.1 putative phage-related protein [Elusimicrobium minutum Pei191]
MGTALFRDVDIRQALYNNDLKKYSNDDDTLILDEMGVMQGLHRVDIAVINGKMHGYEIKSDVDTLARLPLQAEAYSKILDRVTLVVAKRHLQKAIALVPTWWEIKVAYPNKKHVLSIKKYRPGLVNYNIDASSLVQLLWKDEVVSLLEQLGFAPKDLRYPKATLYKMLTENISLAKLKSLTRTILKNRTNWRGQMQP